MKNGKNDLTVLLNFLKSGLSTGKIDKLIGYSDTKGWKSWEILKKYKLKDRDKGKLFLYSEQQSRKLIDKIIRAPKEGILNTFISANPPNNLEKYRGTFVLAKSEKDFYNVFSGETRNIIRDFFNPKKKLIGKCQYKSCKSKGEIDTVHYSKDRPAIFIHCALKNKTRFDGALFKYDVYNTMKYFLLSHSNNKMVCFLCKKHHNQLHNLEKTDKSKLREFRKDILF